LASPDVIAPEPKTLSMAAPNDATIPSTSVCRSTPMSVAMAREVLVRSAIRT
jgi:hypothetical protein